MSDCFVLYLLLTCMKKKTSGADKFTNNNIWKRYPQYLRKQFWKEHTFWTDGYFACSVGNVSEEMLKRYIENQG